MLVQVTLVGGGERVEARGKVAKITGTLFVCSKIVHWRKGGKGARRVVGVEACEYWLKRSIEAGIVTRYRAEPWDLQSTTDQLSVSTRPFVVRPSLCRMDCIGPVPI